MAPYCHPVTELCQNEQWDDVRDMIEKEPFLVWSFIDGGYTLVKFFCWYGRVDMLQFALKILRTHSEEEYYEQRLIDFFEITYYAYEIRLPVHEAVYNNHLDCVKFLVEHCPSKEKILEMHNVCHENALHFACLGDSYETMDYILLTAFQDEQVYPMSETILKSFDSCKEEKFAFLTPQKMREIALQREILTVYRNQQLFGQHSLISLVLGVVMRETSMSIRT